MIEFTKTDARISETLLTNCIFWVQSLPDDELGPSRRVLEDLEVLQGGFPVFVRRVSNRDEMVATLTEIARLAEQDGYRPVLHLDCHGSAEQGLLLAPSGERLDWAETVDLLRRINVATRNNLVCVFALCFGLHAYTQVALKRPVPAYLFAGPESEIEVGFLEDETLAFYRRMIETNNVTLAFKETLGGKMVSVHCQGLFLQALLSYIRQFAKGKARRTRLERLVTEVLKNDGDIHPSPDRLKQIRADIRRVLEPGQALIDRYEPSFLIGRKAAFTYADIEAILSGNARPKA